MPDAQSDSRAPHRMGGQESSAHRMREAHPQGSLPQHNLLLASRRGEDYPTAELRSVVAPSQSPPSSRSSRSQYQGIKQSPRVRRRRRARRIAAPVQIPAVPALHTPVLSTSKLPVSLHEFVRQAAHPIIFFVAILQTDPFICCSLFRRCGYLSYAALLL